MGIIDNIKKIIENKKNPNKQQEQKFIQQQKYEFMQQRYEEIIKEPYNFTIEEIYQTFSFLGKSIDDIIYFSEKNFDYINLDLIEKYFHISIEERFKIDLENDYHFQYYEIDEEEQPKNIEYQKQFINQYKGRISEEKLQELILQNPHYFSKEIVLSATTPLAEKLKNKCFDLIKKELDLHFSSEELNNIFHENFEKTFDELKSKININLEINPEKRHNGIKGEYMGGSLINLYFNNKNTLYETLQKNTGPVLIHELLHAITTSDNSEFTNWIEGATEFFAQKWSKKHNIGNDPVAYQKHVDVTDFLCKKFGEKEVLYSLLIEDPVNIARYYDILGFDTIFEVLQNPEKAIELTKKCQLAYIQHIVYSPNDVLTYVNSNLPLLSLIKANCPKDTNDLVFAKLALLEGIANGNYDKNSQIFLINPKSKYQTTVGQSFDAVIFDPQKQKYDFINMKKTPSFITYELELQINNSDLYYEKDGKIYSKKTNSEVETKEITLNNMIDYNKNLKELNELEL